MDLVWVRGFKQSFSQELGCSVSNLAISFHFSKTKATITEKKEKKTSALEFTCKMYQFLLVEQVT